jgi:hypothetical protein
MKYLMINTFCFRAHTLRANQEYLNLKKQDLDAMTENVDYKIIFDSKEETKSEFEKNVVKNK